MSAMKWLGWIVVLLLLGWAALRAVGSLRWAKATRALEARLDAARIAPAVARHDPLELQGLPQPVQRYFRTALKEGQPIIAAAVVEHVGTFNMGEAADRWKPFTSRQRVVTCRPGFVWNGRVAMMPGLPVLVHDAYVAGTGILHPALLGLFTLFELRGGGDVAEGELMRFFAEAAWYPTALLPSQGVRWEAVDEHSARATLVDGALSLTLLFRFDERGLIESVRAEARGRTVGTTVVMTPWEGRWSDYQLRDGMRVPMAGEVAWLAPGGRKPYWRGRITSLRYEVAPR
jgi:Family of unknown function (DUF6920)